MADLFRQRLIGPRAATVELSHFTSLTAPQRGAVERAAARCSRFLGMPVTLRHRRP